MLLSPFRCCLVAACLLSMPAAAADEATAMKLAGSLDAVLQRVLAGSTTITLEGSTVVVVEGDGYAATLPVLKVTLRDGRLIRSGVVTARLAPLADENYRFSLGLPEPLATAFDMTGVPMAALHTSGHDISGIWNSRLNDFDTLNATIRGLVAAGEPLGQPYVSIDRMSLKGGNVLDANGRLSANSLLGLSAVKIYNKDRREIVSLGGIGIDYRLSGVNFAALQEIRQTLGQVDKSNPSGGLVGALNSLSRIGGTSATAIVLRDSALSWPLDGGNTGSGGGITTWSLPLLRLAMSASSADSGMTSATLRYHHEGLRAEPSSSTTLADLLPASLGLHGEIARVPVRELLALVVDLATMKTGNQAGTSTPADPFQAARQLLDQADTTLTIHSLGYSSRTLSSQTSGVFNASASARFALTGELNTRINGLDETLERLGAAVRPAAGDAPQPQADNLTRNAVMALSMLQGFGQIVPNSSPSARTYKLELTPSGGFKLNGTDFSAITGMASGMAAGLPAAP